MYTQNLQSQRPWANWYKNYRHMGTEDERHCPLPGRCMNPRLAGNKKIAIGSSPDGLGYDMVIGTPVGNMNISIPIEQMVQDVAALAMQSAVPYLKAEIPDLMKTALPIAEDAFIKDLWPRMRPLFIQAAEQVITDETNKVLNRTTIISAVALSVAGIIAYSVIKKRKKTA